MKKNQKQFSLSLKNRKSAGFTLIELLIVIAVMAILTTVVFVALDPLARFQDARNNRRSTDVAAIISAIKLYQVDNQGSHSGDLSDAIVGYPYYIGAEDSGCEHACTIPASETEGNSYDFADTLVASGDSCHISLDEYSAAGYLAEIPVDPNGDADNADDIYPNSRFTGYYLIKNTNGSITIGSCLEEKGSAAEIKEISTKR